MGLLDRVESWLPAPAAKALDDLVRPVTATRVEVATSPPPPAPEVYGPPPPPEMAATFVTAPPVVAPPAAAPPAAHTGILASFTMPAFVKKAAAKVVTVAEDAVPIVAKGLVDAGGILTYPSSFVAHAVNRAIVPELDHLGQKLPLSGTWALAIAEDLGLSENAMNRPALKAVPEAAPSADRSEPGVSPQTTGNQITTFVDGDAYKNELLTRIKSAQKSIWIESYEWQHAADPKKPESGEEIAQALIDAKKANPKLDIRVIVDNRTNLAQAQHLHRQSEPNSPVVSMLRSAGIDIRQVDYSADRLNHRKLSVFDGEIGFIGGQNIGNNYLLPLSAGWSYHDVTQRFAGPAAYDVAKVFDDSWFRTGGSHLTLSGRPAANPLAGDTASSKVQIIQHSGGIDRNIERELIQRIDAESEQVVLENGFGMSDAIYRAVIRARARGVEVVWLWGHASDDASIMASYHYDALKKATVTLRTVPHPLHMKAYYFKSSHTLLQGSSNLDGFSTMVNDEADAQIEGPAADQFYQQVMGPDISVSPIMTGPPAPTTKPTKAHEILIKSLERVADGD